MKNFMTHLKSFINFCREVARHFMAIEGSLKSSSLAYATLISIVPIMVFSLSFVSLFPSFGSYFQVFHRFVFRHFIPSSAETIQEYVELFANNAIKLSATGLTFFLMTAVILIFSMETVFNSIWHVRKRRVGFSAFLMYWASLTLLPLISATALAFALFIYQLPYLSFAMKFTSILIPLALDWLWYFFLFITVPNHKVQSRHAAIGAIFSAVLFEITKAIFQIYASSFSSDTLVYGWLSAIPMFLFWLYLLWVITILGAIISYKLQTRSLGLEKEKPP